MIINANDFHILSKNNETEKATCQFYENMAFYAISKQTKIKEYFKIYFGRNAILESTTHRPLCYVSIKNNQKIFLIQNTHLESDLLYAIIIYDGVLNGKIKVKGILEKELILSRVEKYFQKLQQDKYTKFEINDILSETLIQKYYNECKLYAAHLTKHRIKKDFNFNVKSNAD